MRVEGAISDLHAVDARYHYECKPKFMALKSIEAEASKTVETDIPSMSDPPYDKLVSAIDADRTQIRNSSEIYDHYTKYGDVVKSRRCLIAALSEHFADDLLVFTGKGFASLLTCMFREKVSEIYHVAPDDDDSDGLDCC